jgi:hypothetical protein
MKRDRRRSSQPMPDTVLFDNGTSIDFVAGQGFFHGLGEIRVKDTPVRSGRRPMFVEIRSPDGVQLLDYQVHAWQPTAKGLRVELRMKRRDGGLMEYMVHTVRNRYRTTDWTEETRPAAETRLEMELRPVSRKVGGVEGLGFSYQYRYQSGRLPIYRLLDRGTWEIGGRAKGNEIWMRNGTVPAITAIRAASQFHSTEWYLPTIANPNIFQFHPLQTHLQGFTFTAAAEGVLVTWPTKVAHIRTLIEKPRETDEIVHYHEHCADLGKTLETAPVEVLFFPGRRDFVARANLYEAWRELVIGALHEQAGMRREFVTTYGVMEEWGNVDLARYASHGLPKLVQAGVKTIFTPSHFSNNMNTFGVSNMCCTTDLRVAESVGAEKLKALCHKARAAGVRIEMWGNTSVSTLSVILDMRGGTPQRVDFPPREGSLIEALSKAADPYVRNPSNAIEADHYTPVFAVMNLRDPAVRAYWLAQWKKAHDEIGLDGIFLDSSFNLSSDKFHWIQNTQPGRGHGATLDQSHLLGHLRPEEEPPAGILSQYHAHLSLMAEMQRLGYHYAGEDLGVFGVNRSGPGVAMRLAALPLWGNSLCVFDTPAIQKAGAVPGDVFFRGLAYRLMWYLYWDMRADCLSWNQEKVRGDFDRPTPAQLALLRAYNEAYGVMCESRRTILPGEVGVLYEKDTQAVLWSFEDHKLATGPANVRNLLDGRAADDTDLAARRQQVYLLTKRAR